MPRICSQQGNKSCAFYGKQNYGENHYNTYSTNDSVHAEIHACKKVAWKHRDRNKKKNKKTYNLVVIRTSKSGSNLGMSRLCERCVIGVNNLPNTSGIKIKKIYYSNENGEIIKTSLPKMMKMDDHHMSSFSRNHGYKSTLQCACRNHFKIQN